MTKDIKDLQSHLNYQFDDLSWLELSLKHKSYAKEQGNNEHNEKLEFLGDAVLDLVVSDLLMNKFDEDTEGNLSRKRASVVNEDRLCEIALKYHLDQFIFLGKSEIKNELQKNPRILASVLEAIVGAIYRDKGFASAFSWIESTFSELLNQAFSEHDFEKDYKTRLQEIVQESHKIIPRYRVIEQSGPDHNRTFKMEVSVAGEVWGVVFLDHT